MIGSSFCFATLLFCSLAQAMRVTHIEVPKYVMVGDSSTLKCHFDLQNEKLYTLTWWKDDRQFYQYIPKKERRTLIFTVPGVTVDESKSDIHSVQLINFSQVSTGNYRCEVVGEAPTFNTDIKGKNISVIDPPDGPPVVHGLKQIYHPGEVIKLNCTSYRSRPAPQLKWQVVATTYSETTDTNRATVSLTSNINRNNKKFKSLTSSASSSSNSFTKNSPQTLSLISRTKIINHKNLPDALSPPLLSFSSALNSKHHHLFTKHKLEEKQSFSSKKKYYQLGESSSFFYRKKESSSPRRVTRSSSASTGRIARSSTNYTEIVNRYLVKFPKILSNEEDMTCDIFSSTLGLKFPASLQQANNGQFILRCQASIAKYQWATEVRIRIATVPVADPQQLPTLTGTKAPGSRGEWVKSDYTLIAAWISLIVML